MNAQLCSRLTTDTGTIIELWELDNGTFELLFAEAHRPDEVVYAVTFRPVEAELVAEKLVQATGALAADTPVLSLVRDGTLFGAGKTEIDFRTPDYSAWVTVKAEHDVVAERIAAAFEAAFPSEVPSR